MIDDSTIAIIINFFALLILGSVLFEAIHWYIHRKDKGEKPMSKSEYIIHILMWTYWIICTIILSAIMAEGIGIAFVDTKVFSLWQPFIWIADHWWIFGIQWLATSWYLFIRIINFA